MIQIRITRNTVCDGKQVRKGDVVEAQDRNARYLVAIGKAVRTDGKKVQGPMTYTTRVETADVADAAPAPSPEPAKPKAKRGSNKSTDS